MVQSFLLSQVTTSRRYSTQNNLQILSPSNLRMSHPWYGIWDVFGPRDLKMKTTFLARQPGVKLSLHAVCINVVVMSYVVFVRQVPTIVELSILHFSMTVAIVNPFAFTSATAGCRGTAIVTGVAGCSTVHRSIAPHTTSRSNC